MVSAHYLIAQGEIFDQVTVFATDSLRTMLIVIVCTQDQLRHEVIQAVKNCRTSGAVVRMVNGNLIATVRVITARKGSTHHVVACSSPTDKLSLVSFLMECDEVVAVAINSSNISMGCCGTELANMASDIAIIDDNCNTIVSALKCGCHVYDNTRSLHLTSQL